MPRTSDKIPAAIIAPTPKEKAIASDAAHAASDTVEKCVNCQYYDRRNAKPTDGKAPLWGQCRRHAPHLNPVTAKAYVVEGVWPLVRDDDWCGEWRVLTRVVDDWVPETLPTGPQAEPPAPAVPPAPSRRHAPATAAVAGDD
jgi:hypothetical protein